MEATLQSALAAAQAEFPPIPKGKSAKIKTKTGGEYTYHYADLADILKAILPILGKHGLSIVQPLKRNPDGKLCLITRVMHNDAFVESDGLVVPEGLEPQELGSVLTYWRRYDLCALIGIAPDEDTDGNVAAKGKTMPAPSTKAQSESSKATKESVLAYIVDVLQDVGKKTKRPYLWLTFTVAGGGKEGKAICEDPKVYDVMMAARAHDAVIDLRRDSNMTYPRIVGCKPPE